MRDHYRAQKMALWLNLIPDLQSAAAAVTNHMRPPPATEVNGGQGLLGKTFIQDHPLLVHFINVVIADYRLYNELLPFVPKLKNLDSTMLHSGSTPASSEVLDSGKGGNSTPNGQAKVMQDTSGLTAGGASGDLARPHSGNSSFYIVKNTESLSAYSTALSVTIGKSLITYLITS